MNIANPAPVLRTILLVLVLLAACAQPPANLPDAPAPGSGPDEWKAFIVDAFRAQGEIAYRQQSETTVPGVANGVTTIDFLPPDRYHIVAPPGTDIILSGEQVYANQDGVWTVIDMPVSAIIDPDGLERMESSISGVGCAGPEPLDGLQVYACTYTTEALVAGNAETIAIQLWIDTNGNLPYKMIVEGSVASMDSETQEITAVQATTTTVYLYDAEIEFDVPEVGSN